jgi:hypothetical protein
MPIVSRHEITIFWRVEDKYGVGPYHYHTAQWRTKNHETCYRNPPPSDDFGSEWYEIEEDWSRDSHRLVFGFSNYKQLREWFSKKELDNLKKLGYRTRKIKGYLVLKGKRQVVFERE